MLFRKSYSLLPFACTLSEGEDGFQNFKILQAPEKYLKTVYLIESQLEAIIHILSNLMLIFFSCQTIHSHVIVCLGEWIDSPRITRVKAGIRT